MPNKVHNITMVVEDITETNPKEGVMGVILVPKVMTTLRPKTSKPREIPMPPQTNHPVASPSP